MQLKTIHQRKRKYILLILLFSAIGLTKGYAYDFSAVCSTGQTLYYNIIDADNHYVELTCPGEVGYNGWSGYTQPTGDLIIPDSVQYDGATYLITTIGDYALCYCYFGSSGTLTMPNSLNSIGNCAFLGCNGLTGDLTIPNSVTTIGNSAFSSCSGFTGNLTIPNSVTTIGNSAFSYCSGFTGSLTIPNSVSSIGQETFYGCSGFTGGLTIPNSVTSIGYSAFSGCSGMTGGVFYTGDLTQWCNISFSNEGSNPLTCAHNLYISNELVTNLVIPEDVIEIKAYSFCGATCLTSLVISNSVTTIGSSAFYGCSGFTGSLTIPNSVTTIGNYAFFGCSGFTGNLAIPNSVTTIGSYVFYGCSGFTGNLTIPNSVTTIGDYAFFGCSGFTGNLTIPNSVFSIGWSAFSGCTGFTEIFFNAVNCSDASSYSPFSGCGGTLTIGDEVERIPSNMFRNSGFMGSLTIPNSVTSIGNSAFYGCSGFTGSLTIPNSVTTIDHSTFYGCSGFTGNLVIPNSVTSIGSSAFEGCGGFTGSLIIHNLVTTIGGNAFKNCTGFTEVVFNAINCSSYGSPFQGCGNTLIIGDNVERIPAGVFNNCSNFTGTLTIPNSVTSIECLAFFGCSGFNEIVFNAINCSDDNDCYYSVFGGCTGTLIIGNEVERIPNRLFRSCDSFAGVVFNATNCADVNGLSPFCDCGGTLTIGNSVVRIPASMFENCHGFIGSLTIPNSVTSIGNYAFYGCSGLTGSLTMSSSVTSIGTGAFLDCDGLSSVYYDGNLFQWCNISFSGTNSNPLTFAHNLYINNELVTNLEIPEDVIEIKACSFCGATCLTSLTIPNSLTTIGSYAFMGCSNLSGNLEIGNSVTLISGGAFSNCSSFSEVNYNTANCEVEYWGGDIPISAFQGCGGVLVIGNNVETIPPNLFKNGGFTEVDYNARNCSNASSYYPPFAGCTGSVVIGDNVETIPANMFRNGGFIGNLTLSHSVSSIGGAAFQGCSGFTSMAVFAESPPAVMGDAFFNVNNAIPITVPCGSISAYSNASGWNQFFNFIDDCTTTYEITATVNPIGGGTVSGIGTFEEGQTCMLIATASPNYSFINWTEDGVQVSTDPEYSFSVTRDRLLIANFIENQPNISIILATARPALGGTVSGSGGYIVGSYCTLSATAAEGYFFMYWTKNDNEVSTDPNYSFRVTENATYIANFSMGLPELHVTGITHSTLVAGQQATISWTVQNDGAVATPNSALWHDRVWLSVENRVAANDNSPILLGTFNNLSVLNPGEYYTQTQTFTLPIDIVGEYYLFVLTDAYDCHTIYWDSTGVQLPYSPPPYIGCLSHHCSNCINVADNRIYEQSEYAHGEGSGGYYNDNFFYKLVDIEVPVLPDLQVTSIMPQTSFFSGSMVNVAATISNLGENATLTNHWADALYIASEPDFNSSTSVCLAVNQHSGTLDVGQSYQVHFSGRVPSTMYGEAYFFVYTDCYEQVYEHVMNHNNTTMSNVVNVILSPPADLEPSDLGVPATVSTGESFAYSYKVSNVGAGSPNVNYWVDKIYLSQNADTIDANAVLLKTMNHYGRLIPSASYSVSENITLPSEITSGNYYLYVYADANNNVFEYLYDGNNLARSNAIHIIRPDLQVTQISAPEQITAGYPLNLSYTLTNAGEGVVNNRMVTDRVYISALGNMTDTIRIANIRRNVYLAAGQSLTVMCNDAAPYNLTDGTYHLLVLTDCDNEINEPNEGNNMLTHYPMNVFHQPLPDLEPVSLTIPLVIQAGEIIPVEFDITNIGDLDLLNSNCTFDIYAAWGYHEILCPVQSQTLPLGNNVSIGIGQTVHFVRSVLVPPTVSSACTTFKLIVNKGRLVPELNTTNNIYTATAMVLDYPLPDLVVTNISTNAMQSGGENQISFTVNNIGTADFEGSFNTAVYVKSSMDTIFCPLVLQVNPETSSYAIPVGGTLAFTQKVLVPPMANASCNLLEIIVDEGNTVLEANDDNNATTIAATVINYPFDLKTTALQVSETVWAGETTSLSWTVKNIGACPSEAIPLYLMVDSTYFLVQGEILPQPWTDKVFVSNDAVLSDDDIELCSVARSAVLQPNGIYSVEQSVIVPYTNLGAQYLLCVSDATQVTYDLDSQNNIKSVPIEVQLGVFPDLRITSLTIEEELTSDQTYWVHYTIVNEGERVTQKENWTDAFFIGEAMTTIGALQLGSKIHHGALAAGESYTDSIEILIPNGLEGDYFLIGFTDRTNQIYEHDNENDNLLAMPVTVMAPPPCDLIAVQPDFPATVVSGEDMTVSWQLRNIGYNSAAGRIRNAIYLSRDDVWSSDDVMLGYADININIAVNGQQSCQLSGPIIGLDEGRYYVIVKANILNALNESSYENNVSVSMLTTEITFPTLAIGESIQRFIMPEQFVYYKIEVGPEYEGETLLCSLESLEQDYNVSNGIYISHESVPTPIDFDYGEFVPYFHEQEIIIPALQQGTYYLMAQGAAFEMEPHPIINNFGEMILTFAVVPVQNISISTSIINFEILSVEADHGANSGSVTTKVMGAKFDSIMDFRLVQGNDYLPAEKVFFSNNTEAYATFDLAEMPLGTYAMEAELPGGIITIKGDAFTIEEGLPAELAINIVAPASVRNGNTFSVNIEYGNIGTTDLNVSGFVVVSRNGHPLGFSTEELLERKTELTFYTAESNGNPDVLRPGYLCTKAIMVKASPSTDVSLAVYVIRRQY